MAEHTSPKEIPPNEQIYSNDDDIYSNDHEVMRDRIYSVANTNDDDDQIYSNDLPGEQLYENHETLEEEDGSPYACATVDDIKEQHGLGGVSVPRKPDGDFSSFEIV